MAVKKIHLDISGMTCVNCSNGITKIVSKLDGLQEANVNFSSNAGEFRFDDKKLNIDTLIAKIKKLGYGVEQSKEALQEAQEKAFKVLKRLFITSLVLSLSLFVLMFLPANESTPFMMFFIASIVQFYPGSRFYILAYKALSNKNYDMNVLVALGTSAAYFYSTYVVFFGQNLPEHLRFIYFDGASVIITFILLGKLLEESSKSKASSFLKSLIDLSPKYTLKFTQDKETQKVLTSTLMPGDVILIKQGEKIACDGVIIDGSADIDAAIITGESMPIFKQSGDIVFAGTLNTNGLLHIEVSKAITDTSLANIIKLINQAQGQSIPIARYADKIANIFVPSVIVLSLASFLVWYFFVGDTMGAIIASISVLIISCPCALGLATPIAIVTAVGKGAKEGILIKNPEILELIKEIDYAVFDKTGTLTKGEISVKHTNLSDEIFSLVASLENMSEHPISHAIVDYAKTKNININYELENFEQITGKGLKASVDNIEIIVGNKTLLLEHEVRVDKKIMKEYEEDLVAGNGAVLVSVDAIALGHICLEDALKDNAKELIQRLIKKGIKPVMLTGDNEKTASALAKSIGINEVYSEVLPEEKFEIIKTLQKEHKVMFIGDGVNDSPSLKQADIGVTMNSGADVSKEVGDIILMNNELLSLDKSINLSIEGMKTIKQNLFFAFIYNALGIPLAMGVFYPVLGIMLTPMYAGIAMSFSSVSVVLNALRLKMLKL